MSASVAVSPQKTSPQYFKAWDLWMLIVPLIGIAPLMLVQWQKLMNRPERQFFPILILVAFYFPVRAIINQATQPEQPLPQSRLRWSLSIFGLSVAVYLMAAWGFSPWLAHLALLGVFLAWALGRCTSVPWSTVAAWTGLMLVTLPLPFGRDEVFIGWLQGASAAACGYALDALAVPHMRLANIIEIKGQQMFVEEACSGIASLYALLAAAALLVLVNGRSFLCSMLVIASVPVWAMLGNFLRLLTIALAQEYYQRDLSHGLDHELLGLLTFSLAALGLWMTEWLLAGFMQPFPPASPDFNFVFQTFNAALCWPDKDPISRVVEAEDETPQERAARLRHEKAEREATEARIKRVQPWAQKSTRTVARSLAGVALLAGVLPAIVVSRDASPAMLSFGLTEYTPEQLAKMPDKEALPGALGEWRKVNFAEESRSTASFLGAHSLIWEYRKQEQRFLLSIDFPFRGYHPLEVCYGNSGWEVDKVEPIKDPTTDVASDAWDWREITMNNEFGSRGFVCYAMLTEDCKPFANIIESDVSQNVGGRLRDMLGNRVVGAAVFQPVCYQIQLVCESGRKLNDEEFDDLRQCFLEARKVLREKIAAADLK